MILKYISHNLIENNCYFYSSTMLGLLSAAFAILFLLLSLISYNNINHKNKRRVLLITFLTIAATFISLVFEVIVYEEKLGYNNFFSSLKNQSKDFCFYIDEIESLVIKRHEKENYLYVIQSDKLVKVNKITDVFLQPNDTIYYVSYIGGYRNVSKNNAKYTKYYLNKNEIIYPNKIEVNLTLNKETGKFTLKDSLETNTYN